MDKREAKKEACFLLSNWIENGMSSWAIEDRYPPNDLTRIYNGMQEVANELFQRSRISS